MMFITKLTWLIVTVSLINCSQSVNRSQALPSLRTSGDSADVLEKFFLTIPLYGHLLKTSLTKDYMEMKRQFDPWGGKRRHITNYATSNGKRQFSPWGGKRGVIYEVHNSDDMDQSPLLLSHNKDPKKRKLSSTVFKRSISKTNLNLKRNFNSWGGKRSFNSWGGKRGFNSWGGKRNFNSWGGKRSMKAFARRQEENSKSNSIPLDEDIYFRKEEAHKPIDDQLLNFITTESMKYIPKSKENQFNSQLELEVDDI